MKKIFGVLGIGVALVLVILILYVADTANRIEKLELYGQTDGFWVSQMAERRADGSLGKDRIVGWMLVKDGIMVEVSDNCILNKGREFETLKSKMIEMGNYVRYSRIGSSDMERIIRAMEFESDDK